MEREFISILEDASIEEAYKLMRLHLKEEFPVVDNVKFLERVTYGVSL